MAKVIITSFKVYLRRFLYCFWASNPPSMMDVIFFFKEIVPEII